MSLLFNKYRKTSELQTSIFRSVGDKVLTITGKIRSGSIFFIYLLQYFLVTTEINRPYTLKLNKNHNPLCKNTSCHRDLNVIITDYEDYVSTTRYFTKSDKMFIISVR